VRAGKLIQFGEVRGGGSYISQNDPRLHFGLGANTEIDEVQIHWPSGRSEVLRHIPADFVYTMVEGEGVKNKLALAAPNAHARTSLAAH
jgi:hypothetical protein